MNIYTGLLFQQGFIQDSNLALSLAGNAEVAGRDRPLPKQDRATEARPCPPSRQGAITLLCSLALSPFR